MQSVEPGNGAVVRFHKGGRRGYNYVAVRLGDEWHTSSSVEEAPEPDEMQLSGWWDIRRVMQWDHLADQMDSFEMVTAWEPVVSRDSRLRKDRAVIRFSIGNSYFVAIHVRHEGDSTGTWYPTITYDELDDLPSAHFADWAAIRKHGTHIEVATSWWPSGTVPEQTG